MSAPSHDLRLPDELRPLLAAPWGDLHSTDSLSGALAEAAMVVAVGDVVSLTLKQLGITPQVLVVDFKTQRGDDDPTFLQELGSWGATEITLHNPAASIVKEAWPVFEAALAAPEAPVRIVVDGEEDLLAIPAFLLAPDGAVVVYGMPNQGAVTVPVDAALRERVRDLVARMAPS